MVVVVDVGLVLGALARLLGRTRFLALVGIGCVVAAAHVVQPYSRMFGGSGEVGSDGMIGMTP